MCPINEDAIAEAAEKLAAHAGQSAPDTAFAWSAVLINQPLSY
jgi:hypothetical protein